MTELLKTYQVKVKFMENLKYGSFITAPSEEEALQLFVEEFLYVVPERNNNEQ